MLPLNVLKDNDCHQISKSIWFELFQLFTHGPSYQGLQWRTTSLSFFSLSLSLFVILFWFIYFIFSHHQLLSTEPVLTVTQKKEMKSGSKEGLKTDRNSEILKVASGLLSCFSPLGSFVRNCNRTSGGKIKSLFCYQNTETWPWVSKASEQNRIVIE